MVATIRRDDTPTKDQALKEPEPRPTLEEFLTCCRTACGFLVTEFGFTLLDSPREYNEFSVCYRKGDLGVEIYGENWGENASCDLLHGKEELDLVFLVPRQEPRPRTRKHPRPGQLEQVQHLAGWLKDHASDFLGVDLTQLDADLSEWKQITKP